MQRYERSKMIGLRKGWSETAYGFWKDRDTVLGHCLRAGAVVVYPALWAGLWCIAK